MVAYRLAVEVARDVYRRINGWSSFDRWSLGIQCVRAADSVGANIAEATGRGHGADRRRLLLIARGSLYETEHWLTTASERGLLENNLRERVEEAIRALNGLIRSTR